MRLLTGGLAALGMAICPEHVSWFTHKYVMHGFLTHHRHGDREDSTSFGFLYPPRRAVVGDR